MVASNADSGNNIRMASVVGATCGRQSDSRDDGTEHADADRRGRNGCAESGRDGSAVERVRPIPLPLIGFRDDGGQPATDAQLGGVFECEHRRHVAVGMMGTGELPPGASRPRAASHGANTPATSRQTASTAAAAGEINAITVTAAADRITATAIGSTARTSTSASSSTSEPTRPTSSPLCSRAAAPAGRVRQPVVDRTACGAAARSAVSWEASRSQ